MGKSDLIIFEEYRSILDEIKDPFDSVAFLGFSQENSFTNSISAKSKRFYDIALKNWEINSDWNLDQKYDLIISTRCPYFSKNPQNFIKKCLSHTNDNGYVLLDWGLGDHWRFSQYKVGWKKNGEQEYAYHPQNYLYSCFWNDSLLKDEEVQKFWNAIKSNHNFGYNKNQNLLEIIKEEVPVLINYPVYRIKTKFLWPESPQLYIITLIKKKDYNG